jgi:pyridoxal phosphate enzyme (YggS family)
VTPPFPEPATEVPRSQELAARLRAVRARIDRACAEAGRDAATVTLVVVTKTYPASDVRLLSGLGVTDVAENRDQEAAPKVVECAQLGLRWHFVGQLQTNKARSVARYASCVHAVDRPALAAALSRAARERAVPLDCLVQVSLDGDPARGGVPVPGVEELGRRIAEAPGLRLRGIMAVAPLGADPDSSFAVLPALLERLNSTFRSADMISAGMSGDLEAAIRHGATHLRVGTAVLGRRPIPG